MRNVMEKTILVVDDDPSITSIFEFVLTQAGHKALIAQTSDDCLKYIFSDEPIDLIFLDVKMPEMTGIDIYREILKIRPYVLVVMMTGYSVDELLKEAFELGAFGVIYKPFDIEEIVSLIDKIFKLPASVSNESKVSN